MAQTQYDLDRAGVTDTGRVLNSIDPINWRRFPTVVLPRSNFLPAYVPTVAYTGGAYGDDVDTATAATTTPYTPKTQAEKATALGVTMAKDVGTPRGWVEPREPYGPPPVSPTDDPTITSLTPNTGASGGSPIWVKITGTKFTQWSTVETGNVYTPYSKYFSPTRIDVLMDPRSSPGSIDVKVLDHGVKSAASAFTFT